MAFNWGGQRFGFGNLDAAQQGLYEDNPGLAFQQLMAFYGQGNPAFASSTVGRWLASQQDRLNAEYTAKAAQQTADWAQGADARKSAWQNDYNIKRATAQWNLANAQRQFQTDSAAYNTALANGKGWTGDVPNNADVVRWQKELDNLNANSTYTDTSDPNALTWTKYLESQSGGLPEGFNQLTAAQRGANPGSFLVRRNIW